MPYCPQCLCEFVEGTTSCEECATPLVGGSPPPHASESGELDHLPDVKLVPARSFDGLDSSLEANLAKNLLRENGIPSTLSGELASGPFPGFPIVVLVREEDLTRAEHLLKEFFGSDPDRPAT